VVGAVLSLALLGTSGWGWYLGRVAMASVNRTDAIPTTGNQGSHGGAAMNLLLVGNDTRNDLTKAQQAALNAGDDGGGINTDTMILVHLPADGSRASFVSLPRDSYVQIPGHGWDKLNSAYAYGYMATPKSEPDADRKAAGARLLVQTVSQLTGLQIDHYAEVDLLGFYNLSTVVGGVQVNLCRPVHDPYSGANFPAGVQTISGADALRFVRQRHNIGTTSSDFDRIRRQQVFIAGVARKMLSENVLLNLGKQRQLVQALAQSLTVDQSLDLMSLAQQMQSVKAGSIQFQTLPYVGDDKDSHGRYILRLQDTATEHKFFAQLSADPTFSQAGGPAAAAATTTPAPPATVAPTQVKVAVYNGSGRPGLASSAATDLKAKGYTVTATGNADSSKYTQTEIRFAAGDDAQAATLAASIPGATTKQLPGATAGTVQLVLGSDFTKVGTPVAAAAPKASAAAAGTAAPDVRTAADTDCIN
jgi:LCP family protein required for cell wall assembly